MNLLASPHVIRLREQWPLYPIVFAVYFITTEFGLYLFAQYDISPAVIWPPMGIALAAVFLYGYGMLIPIAAASALLVWLIGFPESASGQIVTGAVFFGSLLQPLLGAHFLRRFGFTGKMDRTRDALALIAVSLLVPIVVPTIIVAARVLTDTLAMAPGSIWSQTWAGGVMSVLVLTPLITAWLRRELRPPSRDTIEPILALIVLTLLVYITFWTELPELNVFVILYGLFASLFWIALRLNPRVMTLAVFLIASFGMLGSIITKSPDELNRQLFATELFLILIAPIFFILAATVKEKAKATISLERYAGDLEEALRKLSNDDRSKNEFIAILAHELRNPLAPVISTLELLKLNQSQHGEQTLIENAHLQAKAMRRLLDDLLDVTRVTQKKFKLRKETVSLSDMINRSTASVASLVEERQHTLTVSQPAEPIMINVDPVRFEQIIVNLLTNGAKYTEPGGVITLSAFTEDDDLVIQVADNGIGIPQNRLSKIFAPFHQLTDAHKDSTGLGIGLSLTKQLVKMHGGTVTAWSEGPNRGSTFTVRLPLPATEYIDLFNPGDALPPSPPQTMQQHHKILVIDDNEAATTALSKLLEHRGHDITVGNSGFEALSKARESAHDIIIVDIGLPDIDGYEVARRLKSSGTTARLIALSGYGQEEDKQKAKAAGFDFHLTKPAGLSEIENAIIAVTSLRREQ